VALEVPAAGTLPKSPLDRFLRAGRIVRWMFMMGVIIYLLSGLRIRLFEGPGQQRGTIGAIDGALAGNSPAEKLPNNDAGAAQSGNRATTYLSELKPSDSGDWIKQAPLPWKDFSGVRVKGKQSRHGVFMYPPPNPQGSKPYCTYRLQGKYSRFRAEVALNDSSTKSDTPLRFAVYGDGEKLWESAPVQFQGEPQKCDVAIEGVNLLTIEVRCPGSPRGAHAVWIEPMLVR
jgi:hypothetical protein